MGEEGRDQARRVARTGRLRQPVEKDKDDDLAQDARKDAAADWLRYIGQDGRERGFHHIKLGGGLMRPG